mmetsp:Transcript_1206/g.2062  ORF Transcript_1206/g.2062 Transcript_1206/m.2062 type:complete len:314 (-) Transcript_1206:452-1393(-)
MKSAILALCFIALFAAPASAVILEFKPKAFKYSGDAYKKNNVIFMNKDEADSAGYVFATNEIGDTLSLLENDFTLGSLVSFTAADTCDGSIFWFTFGANPNCFTSGNFDSCSGISVIVDVDGDTFEEGGEPGIYLAKNGKVVDFAEFDWERGTTEFVMEVEDDSGNNLYADFYFDGEDIFSAKAESGHDLSFATGDLKTNGQISTKIEFGGESGSCGQAHRIKSTTLEVSGHVWSKSNQQALKREMKRVDGWNDFTYLATQVGSELASGEPGTWAALLMGAFGAVAAFVVVNFATAVGARRRTLGYQAVTSQV